MSTATDHGVVTGAADEGVVARPTFHVGRAGAANKLRMGRSAEQGDIAFHGDVLDNVVRVSTGIDVLVEDFQLTARDRGTAKRAGHRGVPLLENRVVSRP